MMKLFTKIACVAALLAPGTSFAYSGNTSSDSFNFTLPAKSVVSIKANWVNLMFNFFQPANASSLSWELVGAGANLGFSGRSDSIVDGPGLRGSTTISLGALNAGDYSLTLSGIWANGNGLRISKGSVNLNDGDPIFGPFREAQTLLANAAPALPEPETYAMMLAGLMMMGTIARRRSRS